MGKFYDSKVAAQLPAGADIAAYNAPTATPEMQAALNEAKRLLQVLRLLTLLWSFQLF
ncbi:MAG: hypothetical protein NVV59_15110 [Chitinophagaceae bacterium]|nr:hypothetical protein [Chitinophagaceae bacterium]